MPVHLLFDLFAYGAAFLVARYVVKSPPKRYPKELAFYYYSYLAGGFITGAFLLGTLNTYLSLHEVVLGKSVMGALFGGIIAVEWFKYRYRIKGSTGAYFVPSLALGIAIGRIGCFAAGLEDYTYGIPVTWISGYDFGDGVLRHPVQLYESALMFLFFIYALVLYYADRVKFENKIFYLFVVCYASQRFMLEYLKPYYKIFLGLNIFQFVALLMIVYGVFYLSTHELTQGK